MNFPDPFTEPKNWRKLCRQLFPGYGPCRMPAGHRGHCSTGSVGAFIRFKTERVALDANGQPALDNYEYKLEPVPPRTLVAAARVELQAVAKQQAKLADYAKRLRSVMRNPGKQRMPKEPMLDG